jgi:inosose dehydratase
VSVALRPIGGVELDQESEVVSDTPGAAMVEHVIILTTGAAPDGLGNPESLGVNLDTGNSWLGGADPVEMAKVFKDKIHHVHWKDLEAEWEPKRGTMFGCGFSTIALGDGVVDIKGVCEVLKDTDIESCTLEIIGSEDILKKSVDYLKECGL